jgi:hypothetical protein
MLPIEQIAFQHIRENLDTAAKSRMRLASMEAAGAGALD